MEQTLLAHIVMPVKYFLFLSLAYLDFRRDYGAQFFEILLDVGSP